MKFKTLFIFPIILIIVFGGIAVADGLGIWQTESTKVPRVIKEGDFAGEYDPADIRGSYSFQDIEETFGVPAEVTAKAFGISSDNPGDIKAKDLEAIYGKTEDGLEVGTGAVRTFIAYFIGMDYDSTDGIPKQAVDILKAQGKWSSELDVQYEGLIIDLKQFDKFLVDESESVVEPAKEEVKEEVLEEHDENEQLVKGKTTVAEVISWGISIETIEEILTVKVDNKNMLIRDICSQNDIAFSGVKTSINALLEP